MMQAFSQADYHGEKGVGSLFPLPLFSAHRSDLTTGHGCCPASDNPRSITANAFSVSR
jgi:hypothetical protein